MLYVFFLVWLLLYAAMHLQKSTFKKLTLAIKCFRGTAGKADFISSQIFNIYSFLDLIVSQFTFPIYSKAILPLSPLYSVLYLFLH